MWHRIRRGCVRVILLSMMAASAVAMPEPRAAVEATVHRLQAEWEVVLYTLPEDQHAARFQVLLDQIGQLERQHPGLAAPKALKAMVLCTYAGTRIGLGALDMVQTARELLQAAITLDPAVLEGSAYITLGNLYQRLPGWPVSFGDDALAKSSESCRNRFNAAFLRLLVERLQAANIRISRLLMERNFAPS